MWKGTPAYLIAFFATRSLGPNLQIAAPPEIGGSVHLELRGVATGARFARRARNEVSKKAMLEVFDLSQTDPEGK